MASLPDKPTFLTLPPELREEIYKLTFGEEKCQDPFCGPSNPLKATVLLACHQTYNEALSLYYKHSTFYFQELEDGLSWFGRRPIQLRERIQDLVFWLPCDDACIDDLVKKSGLKFKHGVLKERYGVEGDVAVDL